MLKAEVTTDENGECTCKLQVNGTMTDILMDLSIVIHDVYKLMSGRAKDEFRIAFQLAAMDEDSSFWAMDKIIGRNKEADHGE